MNLVLVTGSRDWKDEKSIYSALKNEPRDTVVLQGGAFGADFMAKQSATALGFHSLTMPALWGFHGKKAGPIRNRTMLDLKPVKVLAFRRNMSRGTTDCIEEAQRRGIPVEIFES